MKTAKEAHMLNQRLNIRHSQSIVMTPQLRQAIKLLQFSNLELSSYIEEEIEKNPFLENKKNDVLSRNNNTNIREKNNNEDSSYDNEKDTQRWEERFQGKQRSNSFDDISSIEERIAEPKKSLRSHLMEQIQCLQEKVFFLYLQKDNLSFQLSHLHALHRNFFLSYFF